MNDAAFHRKHKASQGDKMYVCVTRGQVDDGGVFEPHPWPWVLSLKQKSDDASALIKKKNLY